MFSPQAVTIRRQRIKDHCQFFLQNYVCCVYLNIVLTYLRLRCIMLEVGGKGGLPLSGDQKILR